MKSCYGFGPQCGAQQLQQLCRCLTSAREEKKKRAGRRNTHTNDPIFYQHIIFQSTRSILTRNWQQMVHQITEEEFSETSVAGNSFFSRVLKMRIERKKAATAATAQNCTIFFCCFLSCNQVNVMCVLMCILKKSFFLSFFFLILIEKREKKITTHCRSVHTRTTTNDVAHTHNYMHNKFSRMYTHISSQLIKSQQHAWIIFLYTKKNYYI